MKNKHSIILCLIIMFACASQAHALYITTGGASGDGGWTSSVDGAIVNTFDDVDTDPTWLIIGNYAIVQGSTGTYAAPYYAPTNSQDGTHYLTVPEIMDGTTTQAVTIAFDATYNYFGLWWGSMDTYNEIAFLDADANIIASYSGDAISVANGAQQSGLTNMYVNFYDIPEFSLVVLSSSSYAFEADNLAVANTAPVPEPATLLLLGSGLLGLAGFRKKK